MSFIRFKCEHCGQGLKAPAKSAGNSLLCPKCHERITVPNSPQLELTLPSDNLSPPKADYALPPKAPPGLSKSPTFPSSPSSPRLAPQEAKAVSSPTIQQPLGPKAMPDRDVVTVITCPGCRTKLKLPESAKQKPIRCIACERDFDFASLTTPEGSPKMASPKAATPQTESLPSTQLFSDRSFWCFVSAALDPGAVAEVSRGVAGNTVPCSVETSVERVRIMIRPLNHTQLLSMLSWLPFRAALAFAGMIFMPFLAVLGVFGWIASVLTADLVGMAMWPMTLLNYAIDFFRCGLRLVQCVWEFGKVLYFLLTKQPYVLVPAGLKVTSDCIADCQWTEISQVLRLSISHMAIKKHEDSQSGKRKGCVGGAVRLLILPFTFPFEAILWLWNRMQFSGHCEAVALVTGVPISFESQPRGRNKKVGRQQERTVFIVAARPEIGNDLERALAERANQEVVMVDNNAIKSIW